MDYLPTTCIRLTVPCTPTPHPQTRTRRTYVSQDVIRRVLEGHCGREVYFVMGVTDVDDKIIARARDRCVRACVREAIDGCAHRVGGPLMLLGGWTLDTAMMSHWGGTKVNESSFTRPCN